MSWLHAEHCLEPLRLQVFYISSYFWDRATDAGTLTTLPALLLQAAGP